ncbi:ATP-binding cassette domain-containing protein [Candidatus Aerophobetes bacterium]|nr:ATP-binding cassette domain-containing protein [Candidatus Aerophobetes bacterium]
MIEITNVSCSFNGKNILQGVSFNLSAGDFLGLVGPNGAGKTTLLRLISGLIPAGKGEVLFDGKNISFMERRNISRKLAMVQQNTYISFPFTAFEVVLMGRHPYLGRFEREKKDDIDKVEQCMHLTKTWHLKDKKVTEISGGELQRVIIAQALVQDTPFLLLDEPTSHLDINNELEILEIILRLNREKSKGVILVSHDLNLAARYCGRLILLKEGKIFAEGEVEKVLTPENIRSVYHLNALVKKHPLTGFVYTLPISLQKNPEQKKAKGKVHLIGGGGSAGRIMKELFDRGYDVSLGVVNVFDADFEIAQTLGIPCVVEAPFSPITEESHQKNMELIEESELVILCSVPFGSGNLLNLKAVLRALKRKRAKVVVQNDVPVEQRDYTGGEAVKVFQSLLKEGASVVSKEDDVIYFINKYFSSKYMH